MAIAKKVDSQPIDNTNELEELKAQMAEMQQLLAQQNKVAPLKLTKEIAVSVPNTDPNSNVDYEIYTQAS